ncbi:hypothetical protein FF1_017906 [Malus domestica]
MTPNSYVNSSLRSIEYQSQFINLIFRISDDTLDVTRRRNVHERVGGDDGELIIDGEVDIPRRRVKIEREKLLTSLNVPQLGGLVGAADNEAGGVSGQSGESDLGAADDQLHVEQPQEHHLALFQPQVLWDFPPIEENGSPLESGDEGDVEDDEEDEFYEKTPDGNLISGMFSKLVNLSPSRSHGEKVGFRSVSDVGREGNKKFDRQSSFWY